MPPPVNAHQCIQFAAPAVLLPPPRPCTRLALTEPTARGQGDREEDNHFQQNKPAPSVSTLSKQIASWSPSWPAAVCFHSGRHLGPASTGQSMRGTRIKSGAKTCPKVRRRHKWLRRTRERGNASDETSVSSAVSSSA